MPSLPKGVKTGLGQFKHPGLWHSHDDLELMRTMVRNHQEPWFSGFRNLQADSYSSVDYVMRGPKAIISRGTPSNYSTFSADTRAAYQHAILWYITREDAHWKKSTEILDAWGTNLTNVIGVDTSLLVGVEGDTFVNAAEIMRWEGNWTESGARWQGTTGFSNQLYWLFARQSIVIGHANYGMASIKALLDFAIYLDDVNMFNYALNSYLNDICAGLPGNFNKLTGQSSEAGRDQSHAQSGLAWAALAAETLENQGINVWDEMDGVLLKASEYLATYNLNETVEYDPIFCRCLAVLVDGPWNTISENKRGISADMPAVWDLIYYKYVVEKGRRAPWTVKAKDFYDSQGGQKSGGYSVMGWGDLIWAKKSKRSKRFWASDYWNWN
ncbi:hypothetical protein FGLOB1_8966 [Fusarium globosum]|uniref:Alginate lyase domain-containing protein n=1 Tax=Fusarium globosum TaxID=78864 RepID=A0A8H6D5N8_9HYPO|nr:hypothetical protein FGLOB1_8966 [Fusarium globosum]